MADKGTPTSFRLEPEIVTALRRVAGERDESLSDVLRRGALLVLGYCPTCQRKTEPETPEVPSE